MASFLAVVAATLLCSAAPLTLENIAPHFSTNTQIIWQAPINHLPKSLWTYQKILPRIFPAPVISNAIVLASFRSKGFPQPSTNQIIIWDHTRKGDDPLAGSLAILPDYANISFHVRNHASGSAEDIPSDGTIAERAWNCALLLGLDRAQLAQQSITTNFCQYDEKGRLADNNICGHSIFLSRRIDGVEFLDESEGFSIELGSHGKIRSFFLAWPNLEREQNSPTASPQQIIACIRAFKTPVTPNGDEPDYFGRIKSLVKATKLTITKITPYYGEGVYGEAPTNGEPSKFVTPIAGLEAVADFGSSNATVRLFSPILSSEVNRLLGNKIQ